MSPGRCGASGDADRALADVLADERLKIVASLIRTTGDWDLAEDAVADALERALERWPQDGVPANPAAWLTTTARRRAIDLLRRAGTERRKLEELAALDTEEVAPMPERTAVADDRLRLVFTCCHPALSMEARVALTLKVVAGMSTPAVARAFLVSEATMGQRLLRAKQRIAHTGIPYRVPAGDDLAERLDGVLAVLYLVFTEGWSARSDDALAEEAIRLARLLVTLLPDADEARSLLALMELQHARRDARRVDGELVTLEHQDRTRWDRDAIERAFTRLAARAAERGPYRIQAELAAVHARALDATATDWQAIVELYDELLELHPTPVVALNRAIAIGMFHGPRAGLAALDAVAEDPRLDGLHLVAAARADLLQRAGRPAKAVSQLDQAIALAPTDQERRQLAQRRADLS
ncbi:MAG: sigma-70 family RNA polymerase sigma factor [Acidimicrobiia bacterium]|nr:sigma-70 family RNA polymerase sigma factor [Acidimicrobiia bacterium]